MRILSTSLLEYPPLLKLLHKPNKNPFCGWLYSFTQSLLNTDKTLSIGVISICHTIKKWEKYETERITFYRIPSIGLDKIRKIEIQYAREIIEDFMPDIIHLNGTEYALGLELMNANNQKIPMIASIQGLAYIYSRYNQGYLPKSLFHRFYSFRDFIRNESQFKRNRVMKRRGEIEKTLIESLQYISGRTEWDKIHSLMINPQIQYFKCDENLRSGFYTSPKWEYKNCTQYSIFSSNASNPLKGGHFIIQALTHIIKKYPNTTLRLVGPNVLSDNISNKIKLTSYQRYLRYYIKKNNLEKNVIFLGFLTEEQMISEYLQCNVYILPSCIENSSNSLCEAQILGVPIVASIAGGSTDFISHNENGYLYRCEEPEQLAYHTMKIFDMKEKIELISHKGISIATTRHDRQINALNMINIYHQIINQENE